RRTPSRTLNRRSRLITRSPTRSSSSTVMSQPVTARTIREYGSSDLRPEPLAPRRELGLALRAPAIEVLRVLRGGAGVVMAAAPGGGGVADGHAFERAGRVRGQLEALDRVDQARPLGVHRLGEPPAALGQAIAEALARRGHLDEPEHAPPVTPAERNPEILLGQPTALERLADEGKRDAHADGVEPEQVAEVVGPGERAGVAVPEHGSEREDSLVLGHFRPQASQLALADLVLLAARHRTFETRGVAVVEAGVHLLARDRHRVGEDLLAEVVGAERTEDVDRLHQERRPVGGERLGPGLERLPPLLQQRPPRARRGRASP